MHYPKDNIEEAPKTETKPSLTGGIPPIPPHNKPPINFAIGTPDPESEGEKTPKPPSTTLRVRKRFMKLLGE